MALSLPDARQLSDEALEVLRLRLRGRELGFTEADLADILGVSREAVCHWWSAYLHGGLDALPHSAPAAPSARAAPCPTPRPIASKPCCEPTGPRNWAWPPRSGAAGRSPT